MGSTRTKNMASSWTWNWIIGFSLLLSECYATERVSCDSVGILNTEKCTCTLYPRNRIFVDCRYGSLKQFPLVVDRYNPVPITAVDLSYNLIESYGEFNTDVDLLNLANNHIEKLEPDSIMSDNLAFLDLSLNHLTSLEKTFSKSQRLVTLSVTGNSIRSVRDLGFPETLQHLYLDLNPMESFQDFVPSLKHLRISLTAPGSQAKATISQIATGGLRNLEILEVTDSPLALDPYSRNSLSELQHLRELHLTRCDLAGFAPEAEDFFEGVGGSLETLWMDGNRLKVIPSNALGVFEQLRALNLAGNDISQIRHGDFADLSRLVNFDISYNLIAGIDRFTFTALEGIEVLNLAGNKLKEIPEGTFAHLHHLKQLDLTGNRLQHLHPSSFEPYALQDIRISVAIGQNPWTCDCDLKWVLDNASWDEKANNDALTPDQDTGPFYDALDEMESYRTRHSRKARKSLFPLTWFTQCRAPQKYHRMVMADLMRDKEYHHICRGHNKL